MKNILGHYKDLKLFGSCGELRYSYWSNGVETVETFFTRKGFIEKETIIKK